MEQEEINKKIEEIIKKEIESKKSEIDNILNIAKQSSEQITHVLKNSNDSISIIKQNEEQALNKLQLVEQICLDVENKKLEAEELKLKTEGLFKEVSGFYQKQEEKYSIFYKQIEKELKAGITSLNLSKSFTDKVDEYRWNDRFWSICFIVLLLGLVGYYGYTTFSTDEIKTTQDIWRHLVFRAPFLIFGVWLAIFFGNRRAESKKLEELYKHKEVMARSFIGYKQTLEELGDEDKALLRKHMDNLLEAMNENSATFLNSEGDKHPIFEVMNFISRSKKNIVKE